MGKFDSKFIDDAISEMKYITQIPEDDERYYDEYFEYDKEDVLEFIKKTGKELLYGLGNKNGRQHEKIYAVELLESIYPNMRTDLEILEALFEIGGKHLFEKVITNINIVDNSEAALKIYYGVIKGTNRRIERLEEQVDKARIESAIESKKIEGLKRHIEQEEIWRDELKIQKNELVSEIAKSRQKPEVDKKEYDRDGYDEFDYDKELYDLLSNDSYDREENHNEDNDRVKMEEELEFYMEEDSKLDEMLSREEKTEQIK